MGSQTVPLRGGINVGDNGGRPPRVVPVNFNFTVNGANQTLNYGYGQALAQIDVVRSIYIDNSMNPSPVTIVWQGSNQNIVVAAFSQGYYPVLVPDPITFTISSNGTVCTVFLINYLVPGSSWNSRGFQIVTTGNGSGDSQIPIFVANNALVGDLTTSSGPIVTGAPGYFVAGITLSLSPHASQAVAGHWTATVIDTNAPLNVFRFRSFVPGIAPILTAATSLDLQTPDGFMFTGKANASQLEIVLSAPLVTGILSYSLSYGLTNFVG